MTFEIVLYILMGLVLYGFCVSVAYITLAAEYLNTKKKLLADVELTARRVLTFILLVLAPAVLAITVAWIIVAVIWFFIKKAAGWINRVIGGLRSKWAEDLGLDK